MSDDAEPDRPGNRFDAELYALAQVVSECEPAELKRLIERIRHQGRAVTVIRLLGTFALRNSIDRLIDAAREHHLSYRDAINVLATAAICRSVREAAELVRKLDLTDPGEADAPGSQLTKDIIRDIARQRPIPDIADIVRLLRGSDHPKLVDELVHSFAHPKSGRRNIDKALLYITLVAEQKDDCTSAAGILLRETLDAIVGEGARHAPDLSAEQPDDLVGALHELSPSDPVLERWIDGELEKKATRADTIVLVAALLGVSPNSSEHLLDHVCRKWSEDNLVRLCAEIQAEHPQRFDAVRRRVASGQTRGRLRNIITWWQGSGVLARTTPALLADIVAGRGRAAPGPLSMGEVDDLVEGHADADYNRLLWIAAAEHVAGRTGRETADLLAKVTGRQDWWKAAQTVAERLAAQVFAEEPGATGVLVDYLNALPRGSSAVKLALRELADPAQAHRPDRSWAVVVAEVADLLCASRPRVSEELLERYLENELVVTAEDVAVVVRRLQGGALGDQKLADLLRMTVGRWYDVGGREDAIRRLEAPAHV
ncbi:hypothetical protein BIV57_05710 [Mangrovactinospora gilvigrisea]|uniref:Uncharacterized protein n=1 Tax=Mangrovactinospora gilvigrisea TaxID=1428644 RepID=A0A1J7BI93_9ACTN|nr:hypothetical protein [Mangrovactinospora gilvigrisea]OIV38391.1 hypothetical protein BIV57_05710 [Mangrovactinospora gilvigrisea]